jgi:hypothetical protein
MNPLHHYTVNTGHNRVCRKSEVPDSVIDVCRPLLEPGRKHSIPGIGNPYTIESVRAEFGLVFTVLRGEAPMITCGVAESEEAAEIVWPQIETLYLQITELPGLRSADFESPKRPRDLPWLAVVTIVPSFEPWLGDFERCLAWTFLDQLRSEK